MVTNSEVGRAFFPGRTRRSKHINAIRIGDKIFLVGYDWAIYGENDLRIGKITYYSGWYGYSRTTSKHLSETGISTNYHTKSSDKPRL